jgi:hypothetical protein
MVGSPLKRRPDLIENSGVTNEGPRRAAASEGAQGEGHDGLAAVAITLLAAALIILLITQIV